ncbi:MAG: insulinase family protein [Armatimonadetes bacterium]|nr:insulinase family protein [Armatimonadota bacterium]
MRHDFLTLDNGLQLVGEHNSEALSLAAGFFCRTGARDETPAVNGVSHFLEHMMFKGTDKLTYDDINKTFDRIGARYNAFTSEENTVYFGQVIPEFQGDIVALLAEMMRPALRSEDFDMEKNVILEEIAMYEDRPLWVAHDHVRKLHFQDHTLGFAVLGTNDSITGLERDQMAEYFARRYASDNLTFAIAGAYDWEAVTGQVAGLCGGWQPSHATRALPAVSPGGQTTVVTLDRFKQATCYLMAPGVTAQDPRRYTANVAAAAIGSGMTSRLHWALVHPGLAEEASLYHDEEDAAGVYGGMFVCEPERAQEVLDIYRATLAKAQAEGLTEAEVGRAVRRFGTGLAFGAESPLNRLVTVGFDWVYRKAITPVDEVLAELRRVTAADCNALLAERPFDRLSAVCVGPVAELH